MGLIYFKERVLFQGAVFVGDPSYGVDDACTLHMIVKPGLYRGELFIEDTGEENCGRVKSLRVSHVDYRGVVRYKTEVGEVSIDSGMCGFWDYLRYKEDGLDKEVKLSLYDKAVTVTYTMDLGGFVDYGFVSRSGFGDGDYKVYAEYDGKECVALEVVYF